MTPSPVIRHHPLDHPGSIKILLSRAASEALAANGDYHLALVSHPDATSPPESAGRLILVCVPLTKEAADNAARVALGTMTARPIRKPHKPAPAQ